MRMLFLVVALCGLVFIAGSAQAAVKFETFNYKQDDTALEGWLVYDDAIIGKRPGIVIFPAWWGPSAQDRDVAEGLAKMGYVAFVADIYGKGVRPDTIPAAAAESGKFYKDRPLVLARAQAAFDQLRRTYQQLHTKLFF
jgi:dienelactone hydrolase